LRYGHCNFTVVEVLAAFAVLVFKVRQQELVGIEKALPDEAAQAEFRRLVEEYREPDGSAGATVIHLPLILK
jgi:hypothetical protein